MKTGNYGDPGSVPDTAKHSWQVLCLDRDSGKYGLPLILGSGEVRLVDLTNLYATLAEGGEYRPVSAVRYSSVVRSPLSVVRSPLSIPVVQERKNNGQ